jgi:uncharacterized membrane protein YkvA (DUF1232 family)
MTEPVELVPAPEDPNDDFYKQLRTKVRTWSQQQGRKTLGATGELVMLAPDFFHLLCKLLLDGRVPAPAKAKLGVAIAYFVSPIDLIPEAVVGPIGYVDDVAIAAYALHNILDEATPEVVREHWAGDGDVIKAITHVLEIAKSIKGLSFEAIFGKKGKH